MLLSTFDFCHLTSFLACSKPYKLKYFLDQPQSQMPHSTVHLLGFCAISRQSVVHAHSLVLPKAKHPLPISILLVSLEDPGSDSFVPAEGAS